MKKRLFQVYNCFLLFPCKRYRPFSSGRIKMNVFTQKRNPITGTTEWDVQHEDYDYHQEIARSAFADMLHDTERNKKYHRALQLAIEKMHAAGKKANVLDIGTGTGLLSIMAARCGADSIVACEAFKPMADCCAKILARNGVADKITLIAKRSTELTVGVDGDMKEKANILVTEVFDTELIGEGALSTFSHAHKYLLEQDCIVVPDSAIIYAQVAYSPTLQRWNKLDDVVDLEREVILKTPQKMKDCPGSAAVHDFQLSQLPRHTFIEVSEKIPVFDYDWSGRTPIIKKRSVVHKFTAITPEIAQVVFMWWELKMDPEGKICLSCAPWWCHNEAIVSKNRPQDTIPWRDHWMQAVYYLPKELRFRQFSEASLVCCQDEYSLWFYIEDENNKHEHYGRPICECGVHMALSRTHVAYLNDTTRNVKFLKHLTEELKETNNPVVLDLNGSSFLGLSAAVLGAKTVYILETENLQRQILTDYIEENRLQNVKFISEVSDELLSEITTIVCDPNFSSALLPWDNLRMAHVLFNFRNKLREDVTIIPEVCEFWAMPVEFRDLHKIRVPLGHCEGIDMTIFDELVERSRTISDAEFEAQPLWEYPTKCRGEPRKLLEIDMKRLKLTYADNDVQQFKQEEDIQPVNGFAVWSAWKVGKKAVTYGSEYGPTVGELVNWYPYTRQAVKILKKTQIVDSTDKWSYQIVCDMEKGQFDVNVNLVERSEGDPSQLPIGGKRIDRIF